MELLERNLLCNRPDGKCSAHDFAREAQEAYDHYTGFVEDLRKITDPREIKSLKDEIKIQIIIMDGAAQKIDRLRESKDPKNMLCDICPWR